MLNYKLISPQAGSRSVCYFIIPEGLKDEVMGWMENACDAASCHFAAITGADWNNDLTPWEAKGVFKNAKPFGGHSKEFLKTLYDNVVLPAERQLQNQGTQITRRAIAGISLSGLFAAWAGISSNIFSDIISISGSMWYDNFAQWVTEQDIPSELKSVTMLLGELEKNSKDGRMSKVQECHELIAGYLAGRGTEVRYRIMEGTHFSPVVPRLEEAFL